MKPFIALLAGMLLIGSCTQAPRTPPVQRMAAPQVSPTVRAAELAQQSRAATAQAAGLVSDTPTVEVKKTVKVGLLLPLSGRNAALGQAMQDAASLSLFDRYARLSVAQQAIRVELITADSGDAPDTAREAMADLLGQGVALVIGPVFGDATEAVAPLAAAKNVPVLSLSNNRRGKKEGTYLLGFSPEAQAQQVTRYALLQNKKRIGVLVPASPLGDAVIAGATGVAKESGQVTVAVAQYQPPASGLDAAIDKLLASGKPDALLLAETGAPLEAVLRTLGSRGVAQDSVQLMGTGMWDDLALLSQVNLSGAWLASSNPEATAQFEARFASTYGYKPARITSLSYDAVALAVTLATSNRAFTDEHLAARAGFVGPANGPYRLQQGAVAERGLAILQVQSGGLRVLQPAPKGF